MIRARALSALLLSATLAWMSSSGDDALEDAMNQREEQNQAELRDAIEGGGEEGASGEAAPTTERNLVTRQSAVEQPVQQSQDTVPLPDEKPRRKVPTMVLVLGMGLCAVALAIIVPMLQIVIALARPSGG